MRAYYTITIEVTVTDPAELYDAAAQRYAEENPTDPDCGDLLGTRAEPDINACLVMLADPGASWPGTEIEQSTAEYISDDDEENDAFLASLV